MIRFPKNRRPIMQMMRAANPMSIAARRAVQPATVCWTAPDGATCCHHTGWLHFACAKLTGKPHHTADIPLRLAAQYGAPASVQLQARTQMRTASQYRRRGY